MILDMVKYGHGKGVFASISVISWNFVKSLLFHKSAVYLTHKIRNTMIFIMARASNMVTTDRGVPQISLQSVGILSNPFHWR